MAAVNTGDATEVLVHESGSAAATKYTDGEPRPSLRGVLHALVAALLPFGIAIVLIAYMQHWPLAIFLVGKEASYLASALFHRWAGISPSVTLHLLFRHADKFAICVSIASSAVPTSFGSPVLYYSATGALLVPCALFVFTDVDLSAGEKSLKRKLFRLFMIVQFAFTVTFIGWASRPRWNALWIGGTATYATGFALFGVGAALRKGEGKDSQHSAVFPWHKAERNGPHEDFHMCIFIADVLYFLNALATTTEGHSASALCLSFHWCSCS